MYIDGPRPVDGFKSRSAANKNMDNVLLKIVNN